MGNSFVIQPGRMVLSLYLEQVVILGTEESLPIAKNHPKTSPECSEQFRPSTHKMKCFGQNSHQEVHPNFAKNLGRQILGNTFSSPNYCLIQSARVWFPNVAHSQGCESGVFRKRCFCPLPKTGGFDEKWRKWRFTVYPQKPGVLLLRPRKPTKMTNMAGVIQAKPPFDKNTVFATPTFRILCNYSLNSWDLISHTGRKRYMTQVLGNSKCIDLRQEGKHVSWWTEVVDKTCTLWSKALPKLALIIVNMLHKVKTRVELVYFIRMISWMMLTCADPFAPRLLLSLRSCLGQVTQLLKESIVN